jgi:hypothetical protein
MLLIFNRFYSNVIFNLINFLFKKFETGLKEIVLACDIEDNVPIASSSQKSTKRDSCCSPNQLRQ